MALAILHDLMVDQLKDLYHAERQVLPALPRMVKTARTPALRSVLDDHRQQTENHVARLEADGDDAVKDAGIIASAQRVEHYEIVGYGCAISFAGQLGHNDVAQLLGATLDEEKAADEKLTALAASDVNERAAHSGSSRGEVRHQMARRPGNQSRRSRGGEPVRYAVIGLGHIAQIAVLPAFQHARRNSELTALVSGDRTKLAKLQRKYRVPYAVGYDQYEDLLYHGDIDAVYIALPNDLHYEHSLRAIDMGVHVLCEKPLALSVPDCQDLIDAARERGVRLMTAYRLHFDAATLDAIELVKSGRIGEARFISSTFSLQVKDRHNIRLEDERGGGPIWDLGVYSINVARALFQDEPVAVMGLDAAGRDERFREVPEMTAETSVYRVVGTRGDLELEPAFEYAEGLAHRLTINGRTRRRRYPRQDQFGAELLEFSDCVMEGRDPEPSGVEGLADVRVIRAVHPPASRDGEVTLIGSGSDRESKRLEADIAENVQGVKDVTNQIRLTLSVESTSGYGTTGMGTAGSGTSGTSETESSRSRPGSRSGSTM